MKSGLSWWCQFSFHYILILSLIGLPVVSSPGYAQSTQTSTQTPENYNGGADVTPIGQEPIDNRVQTQDPTKTLSGDHLTDRARADFDAMEILDIILMMVVAFIAVTIPLKCGSSNWYAIPSIWLFYASGLTYLIGEFYLMATWQREGKSVAELNVDYSEGANHGEQFAIVNKAYQLTQKAHEVAQTKQDLAMVFMLAFIGTMAMAIIEQIAYWVECGWGGCATSWTLLQPSGSPCTAKVTPQAEQKYYALQKDPLPHWPDKGPYLHNLNQTQNDLDAYFNFKEWQMNQSGKLSSPSLDEYERLALNWSRVDVGLNEIGMNEFSLKKILLQQLQTVGDFFIPDAHAGAWELEDTLKTLGFGAGAILAFSEVLWTQWGLVKWTISHPAGRSVSFGVMAALASAGYASVTSKKNKIKSYLDQYPPVLTKLRQLVNMGVTGQSQSLTDGRMAQAPQLPGGAENANQNGEGQAPACIPPTGIQDVDCYCNGNCGSMNQGQSTLQKFSQYTPSTLPTLANNMNTANANLVRGNSAAGMAAHSETAKNAHNFRSLQRNAIEKLKKVYKKGKKPFDLFSQQKGLKNKMRATALKALKRKGMSLQSMGSQMGLSSLGNGEVNQGLQKVGKKLGVKVPQLKKSAAKKSQNKAGPDFNFDFDDEKDNLLPEGSSNSPPKVKEYIFDKNDINKRPGASLWKILSSRFFKSAYPILAEEVIDTGN